MKHKNESPHLQHFEKSHLWQQDTVSRSISRVDLRGPMTVPSGSRPFALFLDLGSIDLDSYGSPTRPEFAKGLTKLLKGVRC